MVVSGSVVECLIVSVYLISPVYTTLDVGREGEGGVVGADGDIMRGTLRAQLGQGAVVSRA